MQRWKKISLWRSSPSSNRRALLGTISWQQKWTGKQCKAWAYGKSWRRTLSSKSTPCIPSCPSPSEMESFPPTTIRQLQSATTQFSFNTLFIHSFTISTFALNKNRVQVWSQVWKLNLKNCLNCLKSNFQIEFKTQVWTQILN